MNKFAIGSIERPGLLKLAEESAEVIQMVTKIIATDGTMHYADGTVIEESKLWDEIADLKAALEFAVESNHMPSGYINGRKNQKLDTYRKWRKEEKGISHGPDL